MSFLRWITTFVSMFMIYDSWDYTIKGMVCRLDMCRIKHHTHVGLSEEDMSSATAMMVMECSNIC